MPLTPAEVHNVAFSKPPIGKRGYNEDEVDQFLDLVEDTLAQLQDENEELRNRLNAVSSNANQSAPSGLADVTRSDSVDEAALRADIERQLRSEYQQQMSDAAEENQRLTHELESARAEAQKAREESQATVDAVHHEPVQVASSSSMEASADTHVQAAKVLGLAQEMADRLTSDARSESKSMLDEARQSAETEVKEANRAANRVLEEARELSESQIVDAEQKAHQLISEAEQRSAATLSDANSRAEAQIRQAEDKANALQADAERKHAETMAAVKEQQNALENRIAELQVFEREYRTRLKTLLEGQLAELNSRGNSVPTAPEDSNRN